MATVNTFFTQDKEKLATLKSGETSIVMDGMKVRRMQLGKHKNCQVIPGEAVASQHQCWCGVTQCLH